MKKVRSGCVITPNYPMPGMPERGAFVAALVRQWREIGIDVDILAPESVQNIIRAYLSGGGEVESSKHVKRSFYLSYSNFSIGKFSTLKWNYNAFVRAAIQDCKKMKVPSFYYGKFLARGAEAARRAGELTGKPAFGDIGESDLGKVIQAIGREKAREIVQGLTGVFCVSEALREQVIDLGSDPERTILAPNGPDTVRFRPMDRKKCRKQLGLPEREFIVAFVGHFIERKGPNRVLSALELEGASKGIFLGRGSLKPRGRQVLHAGPVSNADLPVWLNAADVFALPTKAEGHCNAIEEAMACGLPIISSNIPSVKAQVPDTCGILIDPTDTRELLNAVKTLKSSPEQRIRLGKEAAKTAARYSTKDRAERILNSISLFT